MCIAFSARAFPVNDLASRYVPEGGVIRSVPDVSYSRGLSVFDQRDKRRAVNRGNSARLLGQPSPRKICVGAGLGPILVTCTYRNPQVWLCAFDFIVIMALVEVFGP